MTTAQPITLTIRRPDDWHVHFRDDDMLKPLFLIPVVIFGRAIVMPNLVPRSPPLKPPVVIVIA